MQVRAFERYIPLKKKGNVTCDFQQFGILISVDSDKPFDLPSERCSVSGLTLIEYPSD